MASRAVSLLFTILQLLNSKYIKKFKYKVIVRRLDETRQDQDAAYYLAWQISIVMQRGILETLPSAPF